MFETVFETLGPFVIPVVLFGLGLLGYLVLFVLTRRGILGPD